MEITTQKTDANLILEGSFNQLEKRHKDRILAIILNIVKDRDLAKDLSQEVWIKVFIIIQAGKYNDQGKFASWISRIARNLALDSFRKIQRSPKKAQVTEYYDPLLALVSGPTAEENIIRSETKDKIQNLISKLSQEQQEVVIMRTYQELSFKEISDILGVSINTALGRMRYALMNLRKLMEQ